MGFNFKKGGNFLFALLLSTCIFFVDVKITKGAPVFNSTFPVFAPTSTLGSIRQIREDMSDGKIYITGSSVARIIGVSADHSSAYAIDYSASQPASSGSDFVVYGGTVFMITNAGVNGGIYRYDISGSTANLVASVFPSAGTTGSITFADNGSIYISRGTGVVKYDNTLSRLTPTSSISFAATKMAYNGGKLFYLSSTGRVVQSLLDGADTTISTSGPTSAPKGLAVSNDGSAIYFANGTGGTVKKILASDGTLLWTATLSGLAGMDINTSTGKILLINTSGVISSYDPINTPTSLTGTASSSNAILSWTSGVSDSDFKGATIRRSTTSFPSSPSDGDAVTSSYNNTTFSDTGLSEGTYYYSIFNETSDGYFSSAATTSVVIDIPPDPVAMLTATTLGSTANFSWVNPSGDFSHVVIRKGTDTFPTSITDGSLVVTNFAATSYNMVLTDGTHYFSFFVVDRGDNVSAATNVSVNIDTTSPSAPSGFSATPNSKNITLTWTNPTDPDFVSSTIRRSTTSFPISLTDGDFVTSTSGTTYSDGPLPDGTYYYSIFSGDTTGNTSPAANATAILTTPEVTVNRGSSGPLISIFPSAIKQGNLNFSILNNEASPVSSIVFNPDLKLRLNADPLVVAGYAISLDPTFANIPISPLKDDNTFKLPDVFGTYTIYVKYFSTTGQASETLSKTIVYAPATNNSVTAKNTTSDLFKRTLRIGSRGNDVKALQKFLNQNGFIVALSGPGSPGSETTFFGPSTAKAVSKFQEANIEKILKPYGLKKGTGVFGNTSIKFLDEMYLIK